MKIELPESKIGYIPNGKFIVFEGLDGSGTSTQAGRAATFLRQFGNSAIDTRQPSDGPIGTLCRHYLGRRVTCAPGRIDHQLALLMAADRVDHLTNPQNGVIRLLESGTHVVCTRYVGSSYAYNASNPELAAMVHAMNKDFPVPHLTIFLDIPPEVAEARMRDSRVTDMYENLAKQKEVRDAYTKYFQSFGGKLAIIDASQAPDVVTGQVKLALESIFKPQTL